MEVRNGTGSQMELGLEPIGPDYWMAPGEVFVVTATARRLARPAGRRR